MKRNEFVAKRDLLVAEVVATLRSRLSALGCGFDEEAFRAEIGDGLEEVVNYAFFFGAGQIPD